jgi:hypothetical protein
LHAAREDIPCADLLRIETLFAVSFTSHQLAPSLVSMTEE